MTSSQTNEAAPPPTDIAVLFQKDPLSLTNNDMTAIIAHYREKRAQFIAGGVKGATAPKEPKAPKAKITDLSDLLNSL